MSTLETQDQLAQGVDSFLSPEERLTIQRLLSKPEEFPPEFGAWILDYLKVNGAFSKSQIAGLSQLAVKNADGIAGSQNLATVSGSSSSWVNLPTAGPALAGLANGLYFVNAGATVFPSPSDIFFMSLEVNGSIIAVADGSFFTNAIMLGSFSGNSGWLGGARTFNVELNQNNNNTIIAKYRYTKTGGFALPVRERWMTAIKYGEVQGG